MSEFEAPADGSPVENIPVNNTPNDAPEMRAEPQSEPSAEVVPVNPVRSAAGRLGAKRRLELIEYGKQYEREHSLTPGRQRLRQLVQLGKRYEQEHGLKVAKSRRKRRGDAWAEFLVALARVMKPAYRPAVEALVAALSDRSASKAA